MARFASIRDSIRHGLFAQRVLDRMGAAGLRLNPYYLFKEGGADTAANPELAAAYPTSVLDPGDLPEIEEHSWASLEQLRERVERGHLCIVGRHGTKIAGYTWADTVEVNDVSCDHPLGPGEAYLYDAFVVPEHRGRGLAPYLRTESYRHLREAGFDTFYSISDYYNSPATRFKKKLGAVPIRLYFEVRVGKRRIGQWAKDVKRGSA